MVSRYYPCFYTPKATTSERQAGCEQLLWRKDKNAAFGYRRVEQSVFDSLPDVERATGNVHPTVKSVGTLEHPGLMMWLVSLVCPSGGRGGDPFCGSGSTLLAAHVLGFDWAGSDLSPEAIEIAQARLAHRGSGSGKVALAQAEILPVAAPCTPGKLKSFWRK